MARTRVAKTETVPGLVLEEPDYITLAQELAVRGVPAWQDILDAQFARTENPDRKARFAFVRPSLSPDQAIRDAFFREPAQPSRTGGANHGCSRVCATSTTRFARRRREKYIPPSLAMLEEIQRTGDIFFPKRWMDATLSGHSSASAALMVRTFLTELPPDYPDRLRRIVLSSADELFRAAR